MDHSNEKPIITLPVFPIKRSVLFPGVMLPITVGRAKSMAALEAALKTEEKTIVVVAQRDAEIAIFASTDDRHVACDGETSALPIRPEHDHHNAHVLSASRVTRQSPLGVFRAARAGGTA